MRLRRNTELLGLGIGTEPRTNGSSKMMRDAEAVSPDNAAKALRVSPQRFVLSGTSHVETSSHFPGMITCKHCGDLEHELEIQSRAGAPEQPRQPIGQLPRPRITPNTSEGGKRQQLREIQQGHDEGCGLCTVLISGLEAFAAALLSDEALTTFRNFDSIEYVQPFIRHQASMRLSNSSVQPFDQSLELELIEDVTHPSPGENARPFKHSSSIWRDIPAQLSQSCTAAWTRQWLSDCIQQHDACSRTTKTPEMPTRVLDVSVQLHGNVKLLEEPDELAAYVALSYCWGAGEPSLRTTSLNIEHHKAGIDLAHLPVMFRDVVQLCRALEIRYLWIDSLCVVQNSKDDWHAEAAKMAAIYSNALFTIAASTCRSPDDSLFSNRWTSNTDFRKSQTTERETSQTLLRSGKRLYTTGESIDHVYQSSKSDQRLVHGPGSVQVVWGKRSFQIRPPDLLSHSIIKASGPVVDRKDAPLTTRAWAFQERMLSPRTLHVLPSELVWECDSGMRCECGGLDADLGIKAQKHQGAGWSYAETVRERFGLGRLDMSNTTRAELCYLWQDLVSQYTPLALSFESDRLAAFSGFAARFKRDSLGQYVAGMWTGMLPSALCWTPSLGASSRKRSRNTTAVAPTWSWASIALSAGDVIHYRQAIGLSEMECPSFEVLHLNHKPVGKNPYGAMEHALLTVRALCIDCAISIDGLSFGHTFESSSGGKRKRVTPNPVNSFSLDSKKRINKSTNVVIMYLGWQRGLILRGKSDKESGATTYCRLGIAFLTDISRLAEQRKLVLV